MAAIAVQASTPSSKAGTAARHLCDTLILKSDRKAGRCSGLRFLAVPLVIVGGVVVRITIR